MTHGPSRNPKVQCTDPSCTNPGCRLIREIAEAGGYVASASGRSWVKPSATAPVTFGDLAEQEATK